MERLDPNEGIVVSTGEKNITMPAVNARKFYRQCLELLQPVLRLRKREADVLGELLYHNYLKRDIKNDGDRAELVFSTATRRKIQEKLEISSPVVQQALGGLRKKGIIKGIYIRDFIIMEPEDGVFSLTFNFVVNNTNA